MKKMTALFLVLTILLCGCGGDSGAATDPSTAPVETTAAPTEPPETTHPEETTAPTEAPPVDVNPLTGEALDQVRDTRVIGVMINNHEAALPQCGIGSADIIYEVLSEGSITRLMALFSDPADAGAIGPVRSLRPYYLNIMRGYNAICTSAGGSSEADGMIYNLGYDRINGIAGTGAGYFYRDAERRENRGFEHSLFITGENLLEAANALDFETTVPADTGYGLSFTSDTMTEGDDAGKIVVHFLGDYKDTVLTYHSDTGLYTAYQQDMDLVDGNTGEAVPFKNVLVLNTDSQVVDGYGHRRVETTGEGTGWYARDGKVISIRWTRESEDSPFTYTDSQGNPISFGVGKSYIAFISSEGTVDFS